MHNRNLTDNTYTLNNFYDIHYTHKPLYSNFHTEINNDYLQVSNKNPKLNFQHSNTAFYDLDNKFDKHTFTPNNYSYINNKLNFQKSITKDTYGNKNQNSFTNLTSPLNLKYTFNPNYLYKHDKTTFPLNEISNINTLSESTSHSNLEWKEPEYKNKMDKINTKLQPYNNKIELKNENLSKEINR